MKPRHVTKWTWSTSYDALVKRYWQLEPSDGIISGLGGGRGAEERKGTAKSSQLTRKPVE